MNGFIYFVAGMKDAGKSVENRKELERRGLGYMLDDHGLMVREATNAVEGHHGATVGITGAGLETHEVKYDKKLTWRKIPNVENVWVGYDPKSLPKPEHLRRGETLPGHFVKLDDGHEWLVPVARAVMGEDGEVSGWGCNLPQTLDVDEQGNWIYGEVKDEYGELWRVACSYIDAVAEASGDGDKVTVAYDFNTNGVKALAGNYRVGVIEVAVLKLFDQYKGSRILDALVDGPTLEALTQKKTEQA